LAETAICLDFKAGEFHSEWELKVMRRDLDSSRNKLWVSLDHRPAGWLDLMIQNALVRRLMGSGALAHAKL